MRLVTRKICMIGDFAVGKTSTVARIVDNVFSEKYLTTVGVKIDRHKVETDSGEVIKLIIWDIAGTDRLSAVEYSYLRGANGYLLVIDGTRRPTLDVARELRAEAERHLGVLPFLTLINKSDLANDWEVTDDDIANLERDGFSPLLTSALSGDNVETALQRLASLVA